MTQPRVLLAFKTALAASIAWFLAPHLPFLDSDYSYYAPLGAVISMYPTLVRSVRTAVQAMAGLAVGAAVAFGALALGAPGVFKVALVVGVGVLLAGWRLLGEGRSWVPVTALFVLLIGGGDADAYSINYLVHVVFGAIVGTLVNLFIVPPLYLRDAEERLDKLRDRVADYLRNLADALDDDPPGDHDWSTDIGNLEEAAGTVRSAVSQADESRKGNPRGRRAGKQVNQDYQRMRALEHALFYVRDLTDLLRRFLTSDSEDGEEDGAGDETAVDSAVVTRELQAAIGAVGELIASPVRAEESADRLQAAEDAVATLSRSLDQRVGTATSVSIGVAASVSLRSIIDVSRPFVADKPSADH
ncbi:FUSC family protein [Cryobacterium tepidiphilum]|uniref:FUSC family protein n=1 Tax=Cryobacterium tepidiphilum TaxID=2486026 RepID=UPI0013140EDA|nr:FUSC family protein [Cryobacterium tepidiphilum]